MRVYVRLATIYNISCLYLLRTPRNKRASFLKPADLGLPGKWPLQMMYVYVFLFLQHVSLAMLFKRCIIYQWHVCLSVHPSVTNWYIKILHTRFKISSVMDNPCIL